MAAAHLIARVKVLLVDCNESNYDLIRNKLMTLLRPSEADEVYHHFTAIEKDYIFDKFKLHPDQILPQSVDYYITDKEIGDLYLETED